MSEWRTARQGPCMQQGCWTPGTDRAAGDARFNLHQRWLMPNALQLVGLTNSVLDTVLTANPCMWWQTYGHGFG
ncbi:hypothetical protein HaLaN_25954, partial [Haematococcus lacustris]